ncbi:MAG: hypothetical protein PHQ05_14020 [Sterolibacterium sp.]|nr:hypothetical protein [Sterolibacterium sp.]
MFSNSRGNLFGDVTASAAPVNYVVDRTMTDGQVHSESLLTNASALEFIDNLVTKHLKKPKFNGSNTIEVANATKES